MPALRPAVEAVQRPAGAGLPLLAARPLAASGGPSQGWRGAFQRARLGVTGAAGAAPAGRWR